MNSTPARLTALALAALPVLATAQTNANSPQRVSYPALSPNGEMIAFCWQGDIWKVARAGGTAQRLTVHNATDSRPVWSPDGARIAFASNRMGSFDVYSMRADGEDVQRLTFDAGSEYPNVYSADGRTIYGQTTAFGRGDLFCIPAKGGDLVRLTDHPLEAAYLVSLSPDAKTVYYNRGAYRETSWMKLRTVSDSLPEIWAADNTVPLKNHRKLTQNQATDVTPLAARDGSLTFVSNREGFPNLWRSKADGKGAKRLTNHVNGAARQPSISADGRYVAYVWDSQLYLLDTKSGADAPVAFDVPEDSRINPMMDVTVNTASEFAVSPDSARIAVAERGDLFLTLEKGGPVRKLTENPSVDMQPTWIDPKTILFVAGDEAQNSKRTLMTSDLQGNVKPWHTSVQDLFHPTLSPDGKTVAFIEGDDKLVLRPVAGGEAKVLVRANLRDALTDNAPFAWSPDSRYIALDKIQGRRRDLVVVDVASGKETLVAKLVFKPQVFSAQTPVWLPNGKGLLVLSPEYDNSDLFLIDLVPPETTFEEDELDKEATPRAAGGAGRGAAPAAEAPKVEIYEPGILNRMRRLTTTGSGMPAVSPDSKTIYAPTSAGIVAISAATGRTSPFLAGSRAANLMVKGGKLYWTEGGKLQSLNLSGPPTPSPINFSITYSVDNGVEQRALFEDVWWAIDRLYYDAKLNNRDWPAIRAKYAAKVPYAFDRTELYQMMGEMMEELDSSHLGATAPPEPDWGTGSDMPAFLGIDFDPEPLTRGDYVVGRVIPNSPATLPQSLLKVGDKILSIDGVAPSAENPTAKLLNRKSGSKVTLQVENAGSKRTVTIKPTSPGLRTTLEYEAWVAGERAKVDELSKGQLGYLHVKAMDAPSLQRFLREIRTEGEGKKGVIIDVRFNGGGSTAVDILAVLIRTPWMIRTTRGEFGTRLSENIYRSDALELPTALMINTASFSNAEVIAEGWRKLGLGPIVGEPTPGYVIGTGAFPLWDGGYIRMPAIGAYAVSGANTEGTGRRPDTIVWFDPNAWAAGHDPQLEATVRELMKSVK